MISPFELSFSFFKAVNLEGVDTSTWTAEDWHENYGIGARAHPDYPVSPMGMSSPIMPSYEGEEITGCTINDCDSGDNPVLSVRYHNPTYAKDYTHHMCYRCADNWDMGHFVHHTLKPEVSEKPDVTIAKELLESNVENSHWMQALQPLHDGLMAGYDDFQHIGESFKDGVESNHLSAQMYSRLPMDDKTNQSPVGAFVRYRSPIDSENEAHLHRDFRHMADLKLEHLLRANPNALDDLNVGDALSLQVAWDQFGHDNPNLEGASKHDMHVVYIKTQNQNNEIRYKPHTIQPTPTVFGQKPIKNRTRMMIAHPKNIEGEFANTIRNQRMPSGSKMRVMNDWMINNNKEHGFTEDLYFPDGIYDQHYAKTKPKEVQQEREIHSLSNNALTPELGAHWKWSPKNQRLSLAGTMGAKQKKGAKGRALWWDDYTRGKNVTPGFNTRMNLINDEYNAGNISRDDKMLMMKLIIEHALDIGIGKDELNPNYYTAKTYLNSIHGDEDYAEAFMSIKKGKKMELKYRLLKHDIMTLKNILKERKTPEAMRHKREYDTKYESSPERIKYREELNRERHRRGMYGDHSHRDISHTAGGKLTVEGEHENRQRHFKDKGTLRPLTKAVKEDLELLRNLMNGPMDEQDKKIAQSLMASLEEREKLSESESESDLSHIFFGGSPVKTS